jgi:hypothetical protein
MTATHLDGGDDVVLPQYLTDVGEIAGFEELARRHGAGFREIVLLDERDAVQPSRPDGDDPLTLR